MRVKSRDNQLHRARVLQVRIQSPPGESQRTAGRQLCRTVIHQIKQDSFKRGKSCDASPFFKIEARPLGVRVRFFAQVAAGAPCAQPPMVRRTKICRRDLPRENWTTVQVRLNPAHDASGRVDIWLAGDQPPPRASEMTTPLPA